VVWGGRHELTTEAGFASRVNDPIRLLTSPSAKVFPSGGSLGMSVIEVLRLGMPPQYFETRIFGVAFLF
jgi:hypothetical protein